MPSRASGKKQILLYAGAWLATLVLGFGMLSHAAFATISWGRPAPRLADLLRSPSLLSGCGPVRPSFEEQSPPVILLGARGLPALSESLRAQAERFLPGLASRLALGTRAEFALWPVLNDRSQTVWLVAAARRGRTEPWAWLESSLGPGESEEDLPFSFPKRYYLLLSENRRRVFSDVLEQDDLYSLPLFSNGVFQFMHSRHLMAAWECPEERERFERWGLDSLDFVWLPQFARFQGRPKYFRAALEGDQIRWRTNVSWVAEPVAASVELPAAGPGVPPSPASRGERYQAYVRQLSGEDEIHWEGVARPFRLVRKNNADPDNQLEVLNDALEARYRRLGLRTFRQRFRWHGNDHSNLVAIFPGRERPARPILLADHVDTAFSEDIFERTGERVSNPGADDNASATAGLLVLAEDFVERSLRGASPRSEIWFTHLTGEEFPADCLGARHFAAWLRTSGKAHEIQSILLMDMIASPNSEPKIFQVAPGAGAPAMAWAQRIVAEASREPGVASARLEALDSPRSYLYNTDGRVFSYEGIPVVLLNEHLNAEENYERPHYHRSTDQSGTLDFEYALGILRALERSVYK